MGHHNGLFIILLWMKWILYATFKDGESPSEASLNGRGGERGGGGGGGGGLSRWSSIPVHQ